MPASDHHVITPPTPEAPAPEAATSEAPVPAPPSVIVALTPKWQSRGVTIRVAAYMAGAHLFAAFLFLLFEVGSRNAH